MLPLKILGMGRYLPKRIVPSSEVETMCGLSAGWIERWSGVKERRWVSEGETNSFMGAEAAKEAIAQAGLKLTNIDLIINASGTPEQAIPDGGPLIQQQLGLGTSGVPCFTIHATCLSFLMALDTSASLLATGRYRTILIVSSDVGSVALNFNEPESASLIGDAAAAAVVTLGDGHSGILASRFETYGGAAHLTELRGGGSRCHPQSPLTQPEDNLFHMDGSKILRLVHLYGKPFLERLQPGLSTGLGDIQLVIPHQASLAGVRSLRHFGWPSDFISVTLTHLGNCISASIPATMYELIQQGQLQPGQKILLVGTGAGLSFGGVVLVY